MRFINTGPLASLVVFAQNMRTLGGSTVFAIATLLASTTVLSQFGSTILLSDVPLGTIPGYSQMSEVPVNWTANATNDLWNFVSVDFNQMSPQAYQTFVEYKNSSIVGDNVADTGTTLRGFLPLTSETDRISLQYYQGPITVMGFRVACVRPIFLRATLTADTFSGIAISSRDDLSLSDDATETEFDCTTGMTFFKSAQVICSTRGGQGGNGLRDWPHEYFNINYLDKGRGSARLFLNFYGLGPSNTSLFNLTANSTEIEGWKTSYNGPWVNFEAKEWPETQPQPVLNVSICYDAVYSAYDLDISASSSSNHTEPNLAYDTAKAMYDSDDVARQLGAIRDQYSNEDRGILSIDMRTVPAQVETWLADDRTDFDDDKYSSVALYTGFDPGTTSRYGDWKACTDSSAYGRYSSRPGKFTGCTVINLRHAALIQNIFDSTLDPSLAIQAHLTMLARMVYYEFRSYFNNYRTITTASFESRSFPQHVRGIVIVIITVSVHFSLVVIITVLFCTGTRYSLLDNAWTTISQLATSTTEDIFGVSTQAKDYDIQKMLRKSDTAPRLARIGPISDSGRIGLV